MLIHLTRNIIAGIVVILPLGGTILALGYLEATISDSGIVRLPFYFPGLGLLLACLVVYLLGVITTTVVGRWVWQRLDRMLQRLPAVGRLYATLKQILGYGQGDEAIFQEVVMVQATTQHGDELGLVTNRVTDQDGQQRVIVFVPSAPNPTSGRMIIVDPEHVKATGVSVHDALKSLVMVGKTEVDLFQNPGKKTP